MLKHFRLLLLLLPIVGCSSNDEYERVIESAMTLCNEFHEIDYDPKNPSSPEGERRKQVLSDLRELTKIFHKDDARAYLLQSVREASSYQSGRCRAFVAAINIKAPAE